MKLENKVIFYCNDIVCKIGDETNFYDTLNWWDNFQKRSVLLTSEVKDKGTHDEESHWVRGLIYG